MKIKLEYPFCDCIGYKIFHKKEGRMMLNIIRPDKSRTTLSYARYLMCVKEKRILKINEQVDHIDENKTNDNLDNLQILSHEENNRKHVIESGKSSILIELKCPVCSKVFYRAPNKVNFKIKKGKIPCCDRICSAKFGHQNR